MKRRRGGKEKMKKEKKMDQILHQFRGAGILGLCLLLFVSGLYYLGNEREAILTSTQVATRKLPIYCVETEEPKVALSFDAA